MMTASLVSPVSVADTPETAWEPVDEQRALDLLERALAERGADYRYECAWGETCDYVRKGEPSCLVGLALSLHGVPIYKLAQHNESSVDSLDCRLDWRLSSGAAAILEAAQTTQDAGRTWGEALANAESMAAMLVEQAQRAEAVA